MHAARQGPDAALKEVSKIYKILVAYMEGLLAVIEIFERADFG